MTFFRPKTSSSETEYTACDHYSIWMAQVKVRFFGMLREIVGKREETMQIEDASTAIDLVKLISSKHGQKFSDFVFDKKGGLREGFAYAINGDAVEDSKLGSIKCRDVKEFVILPPISGG